MRHRIASAEVLGGLIVTTHRGLEALAKAGVAASWSAAVHGGAR
jgi:hypothetical protein